MRFFAIFFLAMAAFAQTSYLPVREVRAGMKGYGLTVFSGQNIERFDVEVLGVLENAGPKQAIILAKLSGGPMAHTGVMQGMSGSPVYLNGRLAGAVALAFPFSKDPIAGIRPFEEMLDARAVDRPMLAASRCSGLALLHKDACDPTQTLASMVPGVEGFAWGEARLRQIATPVSFSGFTNATLDQFAAQLRGLGLDPRQGVSGGAASVLPVGDPASLKPGAMISVLLVSGDMSVGADGTVTAIDGKRVYAFGHRFVAMGDVEAPFASADVITLMPNLNTSFKIATPKKWLGAITNDYSTAVRGELGRKPQMVPVSIAVNGGVRQSKYRVEIIRDPAFTPFLLQMAAFAAIDATERTVGAVSFGVRQSIRFDSGASVNSNNIYSGEFNIPVQASQSTAIPVSYAMQTGFPELRIQSVDITIDATPQRRTMQIEDVVVARKQLRPGATLPIHVTFAAEGKRITKMVNYTVPIGTTPGTLQFTVADAPITNLSEFRQVVMNPPRSPQQVLKLMNGLRDNTKAYVRVWRAEPAYQSQGEDLPSPPPSVANIFARSLGTTLATNYTSKITELEIPLDGVMVTGAKTVSVEVKE